MSRLSASVPRPSRRLPRPRTRADLARTGRDFARLRIVLGLTVVQVAARLHVHHSTLRRWEHDTALVDPDRAARWRAALGDLANKRTREMNRDGFHLTDFLGSDLGAVLGGLMLPREGLEALDAALRVSPDTVSLLTPLDDDLGALLAPPVSVEECSATALVEAR